MLHNYIRSEKDCQQFNEKYSQKFRTVYENFVENANIFIVASDFKLKKTPTHTASAFFRIEFILL